MRDVACNALDSKIGVLRIRPIVDGSFFLVFFEIRLFGKANAHADCKQSKEGDKKDRLTVRRSSTAWIVFYLTRHTPANKD